jgi:riboflavin kinase/FMN adenylyltransferase
MVIDQARNLAHSRLGDLVVVTFARHPRALIAKKAPELLTNLPHRLRLFEDLGVDVALVLPFDDALRSMEAASFAAKVFGEALRAEVVVLGYNNRFGSGGRGDFDLLRDVGDRVGFQAIHSSEVRLGNVPISSTAIRERIKGGQLDEASLMLGRPVSVYGLVIPGDRIGRTLGFPTANLNLQHELRPPRGVYGAEILLEGARFYGLVNIGVRPTISTLTPVSGVPHGGEDSGDRVEVHLLGYHGDLYGKWMEVCFLSRIRDEMAFPSLAELQAQIARDQESFGLWLAGSRRSTEK